METTYKFTKAGRTPSYGTNDYPPVGEWSESRTPQACKSGWHVPTDAAWGQWIAAELWEVEVDGASDGRADKVAWERIRFVRRVDAWTPKVAAEFAAACSERARGHATNAANAADAANAAALYAANAALYTADAAALYATTALYTALYAAAALYAADAAERAWQSGWLRTRLAIGQ